MDFFNRENIFILSQPRTGSNYLMDIISKSNIIVHRGEPLNPKEKLRPMGINENNRINLINYFNRFKTNKINLIKLFEEHFQYTDIDLEDFIKSYKLNNQFIVLNRISKLEQFISDKLARKSEVWLYNEGNEKYNSVKFLLDKDEYEKFYEYNIKTTNKYIELLEKYNCNYFKINYNGDFKDEDIKNLFEFLDIKYNPLVKKSNFFKKQKTKSNREYLENPEILDEIEDVNFEI